MLMKKIFKKFFVMLLSATLILTSINLTTNNIHALTTYKTDINTPGTGNIFISLKGTYQTPTVAEVVNRINQIRKEACKQGIINPDTGRKLTLADYKPVSWSLELETYARLRSAEASVNWSHTRPKNKSTFSNTVKIKGGYHSGENLAMGYTAMGSIEGYYSEKNNWIKKSGMYGHYTNMISPSNTLVALTSFKQDGMPTLSALEFGRIFDGYKDTNNHTRKGINGKVNQIVEVNIKYLVNSISLSGPSSVYVGSKIKLSTYANMKNATKKAIITSGVTYKSSNTKIATVDKNGYVTGKAAGSVNIIANINGKTTTYKITVKKAIKVNSIKLNVTKVNLGINKTYQLKASISPSNSTNKNIAWSSSNTKIATVNANGKVTALKKGSVVITATTKDGTNKKVSCLFIIK